MNGIQSSDDHVIDDVKCVLKREETKKEKESDWIRVSTLVSAIKVSSCIYLKYVQIVRKTVRDLRNNNNKAINVHRDQDGHNLVESPCKCIVFGQNNNKLRGLRAQSIVHTIERLEEQIQDHV